MNVQEYKRRLLELETRLSTRAARERERAREQVIDSSGNVGDTGDASIADEIVNADFTEAAVAMADGSRLSFCHRVGERWARSEQPQKAAQPSAAEQVLATVARFRLNGKHLEIQFADGSRWAARFR